MRQFKSTSLIYLWLAGLTFGVMLYQQCSPLKFSSDGDGNVVQAVPIIDGDGDGSGDGGGGDGGGGEQCMPIEDHQHRCSSQHDDVPDPTAVACVPPAQGVQKHSAPQPMCDDNDVEPTCFQCRHYTTATEFTVEPCVMVCYTPPGNPAGKKTMFEPISMLKTLSDGRSHNGFTLGECQCGQTSGLVQNKSGKRVVQAIPIIGGGGDGGGGGGETCSPTPITCPSVSSHK